MPQTDLSDEQQMEFPFMARAGLVTQLRERGRALAAAARAPNTRRAYESDWAIFAAWCCDFGRESLPATGETVALFVAEHARDWRVSTIRRRLGGIGWRHRRGGYGDPTKLEEVREVVRGVARSTRRPGLAKAAVMVEELRQMVWAVRQLEAPRAERDAAILLLGFAGGFRRSELAELELRDVRFQREGVAVVLRSSKTDQEGEGRVVAIARGERAETCPVRALEGWIGERGPEGGALFRRVDRFGRVLVEGLSGQGIAGVVKRAAAGAGLDAERYAGHSLRAGLVTAAHEAGKADSVIMRTTGHRSVITLARYIRGRNGYGSAAARGLL